MFNKKLLTFFVIFSTLSGSFFYWTPDVKAFSFPDLLGGVKSLFQPTPAPKTQPKGLTLDSKITLAPGGDVDGNGQIDSGDTITFSYVINNPTDKDYPLATLETNIPKDEINYIHNIQGADSLYQDKNSVLIPNLGLFASKQISISFDARVNFSDVDQVISTEPRLITNDKKELLKLNKLQVKANKLKNQITGMVKNK